MSDKKILHIISVSIFAVLTIVFFIPFDTAGRIVVAVAFSAVAAVTYLLVKKRACDSNHQIFAGYPYIVKGPIVLLLC